MTTLKMRVLAILSLIAILVPVTAMAQESVKFAIPFDFTAGPKSFPAGVYNVRETSPRVLQIQSRDGRRGTLILTNVSERSKYKALAVMTFERYGDRYFLSNVANPDRGWELPQSVDEKRLIAAAGRKAQPAKQLDVLASSRP
jgi:hypothetical protein